ncbi:MAG: HTH-type transcriptional regulator BetI [Stenotrophomonas maltophilia]|nr:MAG: HTH-type transcriptional regulator BetI [Stenotrophomonas maltophilia]
MSAPSASPTVQPRRRNAAATREAILASACEAFAQHGYEGAGVREIAAGAGVTAMLVNRYFGSKEQLFREAVESTMTRNSAIAGGVMETEHPALELVRVMLRVTRAESPPLNGFMISLMSASSHWAAGVGKEMIEARHLRRVVAALSGPQRPERAAMLLSIIAGMQMMRQMIKLDALAGADEAELEKFMVPVFELLIDGVDGTDAA